MVIPPEVLLLLRIVFATLGFLYFQMNLQIALSPELISLAAYVTEDGLVSHHWKERPIGLANLICPSTGECQGKEVGVGG